MIHIRNPLTSEVKQLHLTQAKWYIRYGWVYITHAEYRAVKANALRLIVGIAPQATLTTH